MTPQRLIELWALRAEADTAVSQEDDGSGYVVLDIKTKYGEFSVTIDNKFAHENEAQIHQGIIDDLSEQEAGDFMRHTLE